MKNKIKNKIKFILNNISFTVSLSLFVFLSFATSNVLLVNEANGQEKPLYSGGVQSLVKSIAVLPFENLTSDSNAVDVVTESIKKELKGKGWVLLARDETVEDFLASKRIRNTGSISRISARQMGKELGVDAILVGSVSQFDSIGGTINVGVSVRLVSTLDGRILWAENTTYTGKEFVYLLGLGQIKSYAKLSSYVARDLVEDIADKFFMDESVLSPFEIERVITYPTISKAGEKIDLKVKVLPIEENAKDVKVIIDGQEISLEKDKEGLFIGSFIAPGEEGKYSMDIFSNSMSGDEFKFQSIASHEVDNTSPLMELNVSSDVFSTTGSKSNRYILFEPKLLNLDEVFQWKMEIFNDEGRVIRNDQGFHKVPSQLIWRGESNANVKHKNGKIKDGYYFARLTVNDKAGNESLSEEIIRLKNKPTEVVVEMNYIDRDNVQFDFKSADAGEIIENLTFKLLDRKGKIVRQLEGVANDDGSVNPIKIKVDPTMNLSKMFYYIEAFDNVGNVYKERKTVPSLMTFSTPFAKNKDGDNLRPKVTQF